MFDFLRAALHIRAMTLEKDSDLVGLLIGPTQVISKVVGNFPGRDSVRQRGNCRDKMTARGKPEHANLVGIDSPLGSVEAHQSYRALGIL